ncbi:hypothetical protein JTB14_014184 [Gonioctena quinquepunctata]|nr:hypothetical protein JTB14_014184 [Gonioctena quinquepunctata]
MSELYDGDPCTTNGIEGTCKFLTKCKSVLEEIQKGVFPSMFCGFEGTQSIVCCTDSTASTITTRSPPMITTVTSHPITSTTSEATRLLPIVSEKVGDRATEMCKKYSQYAYETSDVLLSLIPSKNSKTLECAFEKEVLIVGGTLASRKEFPHMAQIGYITGSEIAWACGGSLISENFIITAAHCIWSHQLGAAKLARVGITNISDTSYLQTRNVQQIIKHPEYVGQKYNDIALLKMDRNFDMNSYVRPACVYTQESIPHSESIATGWGKVGFSQDDSKELLKVTLEFFTNEKCNKTYRRDIIQPGSSLSSGIVENLMVCAGSSGDFKDTCQGDSGGPLQIYHEDTAEIKCMYDIIGITSFGKSCGLAKNVPGVYTRVSAYMKWIEENVWPR